MAKPVKIQVIKTQTETNADNTVGYSLFPELYANIYIAAKKKSGKTTLIYNILKKCSNKQTKVLIFAPTISKDETYTEIFKMLDKKGIEHSEYEHFIDEEKNDLIQMFINEAKERNVNEIEPEVPVSSKKYISKEEARIIFGDELPKAQIEKKIKEDEAKAEEMKKKQAEKKKKGKGKMAPEYILVFDDLGEDLRRKSISQLLIKNRHYKTKVIISSQWLNYLMPSAIRQLDYCLIFGGFPVDKMQDLHLKLDISESFEKFYEIYKEATRDKYNFLYIDIAGSKFKRNFNNELH